MAQTQSLIRQSSALAGGHPIVFGGDFNSNDYLTNHVYNAPVKAMAAARAVDARSVTGTRYNNQYNSANQYLRRPARGGYDIDYVFGSGGVAVGSWGQLMKMSGGALAGTIPSDHNPVWAWIAIAS
jgi:endonuclease/exonuclease/phosphatase family metal-dependent hydrolase